VAERTGDESPTCPCWQFVLHHIWFQDRAAATNHESSLQHNGA